MTSTLCLIEVPSSFEAPTAWRHKFREANGCAQQQDESKDAISFSRNLLSPENWSSSLVKGSIEGLALHKGEQSCAPARCDCDGIPGLALRNGSRNIVWRQSFTFCSLLLSWEAFIFFLCWFRRPKPGGVAGGRGVFQWTDLAKSEGVTARPLKT